MSNTIEQYRQAKQDIQKLHGAAKKDLVARFNELANELLLIQKELREEFSVKLPIPTKPRTARANASTRTAKPAPVKSEATRSPASTAAIAGLEKKLALQQQKLGEATKGGKPEKPIKDRIYEIEDELRLARER